MVAGISRGEGASGVHRTGEHIPCMEGALVQVHRGGARSGWSGSCACDISRSASYNTDFPRRLISKNAKRL